jgi:uncharacterized protein YjbJ (UPF0337 family)
MVELSRGTDVFHAQQVKNSRWIRTALRARPNKSKGKMKEVVGKVTHDSKLEREGKANQAKGKIQNTIGGIQGRPARQVIPHVLINLGSTPARMVLRRAHVF